jgi:hypothetical protein
MSGTTHTVTLEVELDVDAPDGVGWTREMADEVERWLAVDVLGGVDGREVAVGGGVRVRVVGHSVVGVPGAWPMR